MSFPYFVYIAHLTKFTRGSSPSGKIFARGKIKRGRNSWVKKKTNQKKTGRRRKREYHSFEKTCDWCWWSSTLASRFRPKRSPPFQSLPYIMLKKTFPFLNASTSLDTKTLSIEKGYFSREILIHRHRREEVPLSHWFAVSGVVIISLSGASCL